MLILLVLMASGALKELDAAKLVTREFGTAARLEGGGFVEASIHARGAKDLAAAVTVDLSALGQVKAFDLLTGAPVNPERWLGQSCQGLVFLHNIDALKSDSYMTYGCFSTMSVLRHGKHQPKDMKADGVVLAMQDGSRVLVYWTGKKYKSTYLHNE